MAAVRLLSTFKSLSEDLFPQGSVLWWDIHRVEVRARLETGDAGQSGDPAHPVAGAEQLALPTSSRDSWQMLPPKKTADVVNAVIANRERGATSSCPSA